MKELWQSGVNVSLGYDDIMDPWYPLGTGVMIQPTHMAVHACHMTGREEVMACYDMVTEKAARTLSLDGYGVAEGNWADFVLVDAAGRWEAIRRQATTTLVVRDGERGPRRDQPGRDAAHGRGRGLRERLGKMKDRIGPAVTASHTEREQR